MRTVPSSRLFADSTQASGIQSVAPSPPNMKGTLRERSMFRIEMIVEAPARLTSLYLPFRIAAVEPCTSETTTCQSPGTGENLRGSVMSRKSSNTGSEA